MDCKKYILDGRSDCATGVHSSSSKLKILLIIVWTISFSSLIAQETYQTYGLKSIVKELMIKLYYAEESDGKLIKGMLSDSRVLSQGTRFVEFDSLGNVTSVSRIDCSTMEYFPWYSFERGEDTIVQTNLNYEGEIVLVRTMHFKNGKLHKEYLEVDNDVSLSVDKYINCHEEYFYDSLGALVKILKYDENMGIVAMHEMVSRNNANTLIEEVVIDCTPYMKNIFNPGNKRQYERTHKNILYSIYRKYDSEGRLRLMYEDKRRQLKEYDEAGKLIKWSSVEKDHETIASSSTYIYLDNGLLSQKVRRKEGVETVVEEYTYMYNEEGDWIRCVKKGENKSYIYEREIVYW